MINHNEWTEKASHKCTQLQMRFIIYQTGNVELVIRRWHSRIIDTVIEQQVNSHKQFHFSKAGQRHKITGLRREI